MYIGYGDRMRKITISIQDSSLYFKFRNKKLDDVNLLNTNVISNNELVFSDEYIKNNERLVSLFIHDLIKENNINKVILSNNSLFDLVFTVIKNIKEIDTIEFKEDINLSYELCEKIVELGSIKNVNAYQIPTFMIELLDKNGINANSNSEVLFTSQFMMENELTSYSKIYYSKSVSFGEIITPDDLNDFSTFCTINNYLKVIKLKTFNLDDIKKITTILDSNKRKHIIIEIHENLNKEDDVIDLRIINKELKSKGIKIELIYSKDYLEKNYPKQVIFTTLEICSLIIFGIIGLVSAFLVYNYYESDRKVTKIQNELKEVMEEDKTTEEVEDEEPTNSFESTYINSYDKLLDINSDTVGWLTVKNTNIDYPVVRTTDNDYYLNRNFYKEKDPNGWVFMDYRNSIDELGRHTIIYAHNRYYSGVMFGSLNNVTKWKWYSVKDNWDITFNTLYENHTWRIFSIYSIDVTSDYLYTTFESDESYQTFIDLIKNRTDIKFTTEVDKDDKILTLSTCLNGDRRLVVHAVLVEE